MAFENLSDRLTMATRRITGRARLNEKDIDEMMREVRLSLLEADVNYKVVKDFINDVKMQAYGDKILKGLNPGQHVVKVVREELQKLMGDEAVSININPTGITTIMMVGLQGAGKTTTVGKLGSYLRKNNDLKPMFIAADIYRPAAIEQLKTTAKNIDVEVFEKGTNVPVLDIVKEGMKYAESKGYNLVIIDTAGRLHIDDLMMKELIDVKKFLSPNEILLTVDAMTGQDAVNVASTFHESLNTTGCILTKLDGDTRGGAALSIRKVTGVPIKFMGLGEKINDFEVFHPERMASRILGMGDVLTLIDKATENIDEDEALGMMEKMMSGKYNYNDMLKQFKWIKRMGSFGGIMKLIPGVGKMLKGADLDDKKFKMIEVIISSMTKQERREPALIDRSSSRRRRIAKGAGRSVTDINRLIQSFDQQKKQMKQFSGMDQSQMENMANDLNSGKMPGGMGMGQPTRYVGKGKGKGKGSFRK